MAGKFARFEYVGEHFVNVVLNDGRTVQVRRSDLSPVEVGLGFDLDPKAEILEVFPSKPPEKPGLVYFDSSFLERVNTHQKSAA